MAIVLNLNWHNHIRTNMSLYRPTDIAERQANPAKARIQLYWKANHTMDDVARLMIEQRVPK